MSAERRQLRQRAQPLLTDVAVWKQAWVNTCVRGVRASTTIPVLK